MWELAKSGRKGDPPGLTKPEFERAACLVSFGIHESASSLRRRPTDGGAFAFGGVDADKKRAKRLRYARAGMFWKFEAFDVRPKERARAEEKAEKDEETTERGSSPGARTLSAARPLVAPITLDVPVRRRERERAAVSSSSDDEDEDADGSSARRARFVAEDSAEVPPPSASTRRRAEGSAPADPTDPFADLVAAMSANPHASPRVASSLENDPRRVRAFAGPSRRAPAPRPPDEVAGAPSASIDANRLRLADETPEARPPEALTADRGTPPIEASPRGRPRQTPTPAPTPTLSAPSAAFDPASAFETLRGPEARAFDFSGRAFESTADTSTRKVEAVGEDAFATASRARARDDDDVPRGLAREEPEPEETFSPFRDAFSGGFFDDADRTARSPPRPARDPEMEEWSAACRAWPWLMDAAMTDEKRDEGETEAEPGWAAF